MKDEYKDISSQPAQPHARLHRVRIASQRCYQRISRGLAGVRTAVEREFGRATIGYEQLLKSAMNEAEALAWQTPYPHLFFPALAEEKAAAVQQWVTHQRAVRQGRGRGRPLGATLAR